MEIESGDDEGFFRLSDLKINDGSIVRPNEVYYRWKLPKNKRIKGFNKDYLVYQDGYHYIPRNPQIDTRKLAYALESKIVPSTGNTETFITEFERIRVPNDYCPDITPCVYDWCGVCSDLNRFNRLKSRGRKLYSTITDSGIHSSTTNEPREELARKRLFLLSVCVIFAAIVILALLE